MHLAVGIPTMCSGAHGGQEMALARHETGFYKICANIGTGIKPRSSTAVAHAFGHEAQPQVSVLNASKLTTWRELGKRTSNCLRPMVVPP